MLRAMPNFHVYRPADATETAAAWYSAVSSKKTPTALVLTRQNLPQLAGSSKEALKGAYILENSAKEVPDAIIIATGSEVELAVGAKAELAKELGLSMPTVLTNVNELIAKGLIVENGEYASTGGRKARSLLL